MQHNQITGFFLDIATRHKAIKHDQPFSATNSAKRKAFFRSEDEYNKAAAGKHAAYPNLVLHDHSGTLSGESDVQDIMIIGFEIRGHATSADNETEKQAIKQHCKEVAFTIIQEIDRLMDENGARGPFPGFELQQVGYSFTGPVGAGTDFGCRVDFPIRTSAFNRYDYDPSLFFDDEL